MRVVVQPVPKSGPNGDRDTQRHPYLDYRIHLCEEGAKPTKETKVHEVSGFDHWWTCPRNREDVAAEAMSFARRLSRRMKTGGVIILKEKH